MKQQWDNNETIMKKEKNDFLHSKSFDFFHPWKNQSTYPSNFINQILSIICIQMFQRVK